MRHDPTRSYRAIEDTFAVNSINKRINFDNSINVIDLYVILSLNS